MTKALSTSS